MALESQLTLAHELAKQRKERRLARKSLGLQVALQYLQNLTGVEVPFHYTYEQIRKGKQNGFVATLFVPSYQEEGWRGTWRSTTEEAETRAVVTTLERVGRSVSANFERLVLGCIDADFCK